MVKSESVTMDYLEAPLNPCSVESILEPITLQDGKTRIWLIMLACYELQEETGRRHGQLDLYTVSVPDMSNHNSLSKSMVLRFGKPQSALTNEESQRSGILDGKWIRAPSHFSSNNSKSNDDNDGDNTPIPEAYYFASAHSSGDISIHSCVVKEDPYTSSCNDTKDEASPIHMELVGKSQPLPSIDASHPGRSPLCLSLNWDAHTFQEASRIVSTYSDGRVAIHDVSQPSTSSPPSSTTAAAATPASNHSLQIFQRITWEAHTMFASPAEVWSAGFVGGAGTDMVMTGGDDGSLKLWDLRSTNRATQVLKHFDAGVTVVAPHPRLPNLVACGSYDESICLYDIRYLSPKKPMGHSGPLGGGIWRIKWHPVDDCQMLVAAMHGGCRVVQIDTLENDTLVMTATRVFTEHKSMAYGADWLVCKHPTEEGYFEAAASCSFYDKAVYLWDTVA